MKKKWRTFLYFSGTLIAFAVLAIGVKMTWWSPFVGGAIAGGLGLVLMIILSAGGSGKEGCYNND